MAQQNFWEQDKIASPPTGGGGPKLIVAPKKDPPSGWQFGEDGQLHPIPNGPADPHREGGELDTQNGKATESQAKSASFLGRMVRANTAWSQVPEDERGPRGNVRQAFHDIAPGLENTFLNSDTRQLADQNVEDFIAASLRQESGASINADEFKRQYRIFFPMPGDGPEVIKQKALAREQAIEGFKLAAGPLADETLASIHLGDKPDPASPPEGSDGQQALGKDEFLKDGVRFYRDPETGEELPVVVGGSVHPEDRARLEAMKQNSGAGTAGVMGAGNVLTFGFGDEIDAGLNAFAGAMRGQGSFGDLYQRNKGVNDEYEKYLRDKHAVAYVAGQLVAGLAIPTGAQRVAARAAAEALAAGATEAQATRAAASAAAMRLGKEGAIGGGVYGAGDSNGDIEDRIASAAVSSVVGGAAGYGIGRATGDLSARRGPRPSGGNPDAVEAAQAAQDLQIDLPKFVVGGERAKADAGAYEQSAFGVKPISQAANKLISQSQDASNRIAGSVGSDLGDPVVLGDTARNAGRAAVKANRTRIGVIYAEARKAANDELVPPTETMQTLKGLIREERAVPGGTKVGSILDHYAKAFEDGGPMSIEGARKMRSELRSRLRDESGLTADAADRLTNHIMDAVGRDIDKGLNAAGKGEAATLFRQADAEWSKWLTTEDDVLKPYLGKDLDNWGADVAKKIASDAKGNGERLGQFLAAIPEEEANNVRATLISRLGKAKEGSQDAAGESFSLDTFLTNWNYIKGARERIFPPETLTALGKLAKVAEVAKEAGRSRNFSGTGKTVFRLGDALPTVIGATGMAFDWKALPLAVAAGGLNALRVNRAAKLLASPKFAQKLASTPANPQAAYAFWSRPWVASMARSNPQIAAEVLDFQRAVLGGLNETMSSAPRAAASDGANPKGKDADQ